MENKELQDFIKCFIDNLKKDTKTLVEIFLLSLINLQQSTLKEIIKELKKEEAKKNDNIDNN